MKFSHCLKCKSYCLLWIGILAMWGCGGTARLEAVPSIQSIERTTAMESETRELKVAIHNRGTVNAEIASIETGCSCTVPTAMASHTVPAGGSLEIPLKIEMPEFEEKTIFVTVHSNATPPTTSFRVVLRPKRDALPRSYSRPDRMEVRVKSLGQAVEDSLELTTWEKGDGNHWITGMECSDPDAVSISGPPKIEDKIMGASTVLRTYTFPLRCLLTEDERKVVMLKPVYSGQGDSRIRVQCIVEHAPPIRAVPSVVQWDERETELLLIAAEETPFLIQSAQFEPAIQGHVVFDDQLSDTTHTLKLRREGPDIPLEKLELLIKTSLPECGIIRVPVQQIIEQAK